VFKLKLGIIPKAEQGGVGITFNDKSLFFEMGEIQIVLITEKRIMGITVNDKSLCLD